MLFLSLYANSTAWVSSNLSQLKNFIDAVSTICWTNLKKHSNFYICVFFIFIILLVETHYPLIITMNELCWMLSFKLSFKNYLLKKNKKQRSNYTIFKSNLSPNIFYSLNSLCILFARSSFLHSTMNWTNSSKLT